MKTIEHFNYSNIAAVQINYNMKVALERVYVRLKFSTKQISEYLQMYDNESYRIIPIIQQGLYNELDAQTIANNVCRDLKGSYFFMLLSFDVENIIRRTQDQRKKDKK